MPKSHSGRLLRWAVATVFLTTMAHAADNVERAQKLVDAGEFEQAVKTLDFWLDTQELSDTELTAMYRLLGLAHLYLGNEDKARQAFEKLFRVRPDFDLPQDAPPKVRTLYERIRERTQLPKTLACEVSLVQPLQAEFGQAATVKAALRHCPPGAKTKLFFRRSGTETFHSVEFAVQVNSQELTAILPAYFVPHEQAPYDFDVYVEVNDLAARRLAHDGDAFSPQKLRATPRQATGSKELATPNTRALSPWVWVGVAAAGAVIAGIVLFSPPDSKP